MFEILLKIVATGASVTSAALAVQRYLTDKKSQGNAAFGGRLRQNVGKLLLSAALVTALVIAVSSTLSYLTARSLGLVSDSILKSMGDKKNSIDQIADGMYGVGKAPPEFYEAMGSLITSHKIDCETTDFLDLYRNSYNVRLCYTVRQKIE